MSKLATELKARDIQAKLIKRGMSLDCKQKLQTKSDASLIWSHYLMQSYLILVVRLTTTKMLSLVLSSEQQWNN